MFGLTPLFKYFLLYHRQNIQYWVNSPVNTNKMDIFEWQERDESVPLWVHMIAGSFAGLSEHLSMLPLDNIKTHCQVGSQLRFKEIVGNIYRAGGFYNFYSGSSILAMGCIPAHAIYFSIYQQSKKFLQINNGGQFGSLMFGVVGAASSLFHDLILTPTEVIKQRLQLIRSVEGVKWVSNFQLIQSMYKNEGIIAFYRSFGVNYLMNMPFASMLIFTNENLKLMFGIKNNQHHIQHYICGGLAGGIASVPTTPFDVIKTKLNTQSCYNSACEKKSVCKGIKKQSIQFRKIQTGRIVPKITQSISTNKENIVKYHNIVDTASTIFREEGAKGFFKGLKMRVAIQSTSSAIAWGVYQSMNNALYKVSSVKH